MKRVVTGFDALERAVILRNGPPSRTITFDTMPGLVFEELWSTDSGCEVTDYDPLVGMDSLVPGPAGTRFRVVTIPPETMESAKALMQPGALKAAAQELAAKLPGFPIETDSLDPAMHATQTIDYGIILSGEITLELDSGESTTMQAGDCVIQQATKHAWRNRGAEPCQIAFIMIGLDT